MACHSSDADLEAANRSENQGKTVGNDATGETLYSIFNKREKIFIAIMASISTFFSPMSANIYFPALNTIANDLQISNTMVNLTITTYMIFQGLAPSVVGGLSDSLGRRPLYIFCFVTYIIANIALGVQNSFAALMVLRCFQSTGISGTVALSNAVIADIITSAERGTYIGWASVGGALGPALSPIIGGLLSQYLGYHAVFWFLAIFGGVFFIPLFLFFPETCRQVVGDGSVRPPKWNKSILNHLDERRRREAGESIDFTRRDELAKKHGLKIPNPIMATFSVVAKLETGLLLIFISLLYAVLYSILTSIPAQFNLIYGFNNLEIGLVFLALGVGGLIAAFTQGKVLDWNYARHARRLGIPVSKRIQLDLPHFPLERARLEISVPIVLLSSLLIVAYGWTLDRAAHVAAPLVLLWGLGYLAIASFNPLSILMVELHPRSPAAATAAVNFARCLLGAAAAAAVIPMINALNPGWAFTLVAAIQTATVPLQLAIIRWGPAWRARQRLKDEKRHTKNEDDKETKMKKAAVGGEEKPRTPPDARQGVQPEAAQQEIDDRNIVDRE